jgi:hypothetical protein
MYPGSGVFSLKINMHLRKCTYSCEIYVTFGVFVKESPSYNANLKHLDAHS